MKKLMIKPLRHESVNLRNFKVEERVKNKGEKTNLEFVGIIFYSVVCAASLVLAILYANNLLLFYFFICTSIVSSIMLLWWGGSKKKIEMKKGQGGFLKLIYWLGFLLVLLYLYIFLSSAYEAGKTPLSDMPDTIKMIILFSGLSLMFLSLLTANLLYRKAVIRLIKETTEDLKLKQKERKEQEIKEKKKEEVKEEKEMKTEKTKEIKPVPEERKKSGKTIETKLDELFNMLEQNKSVKLSVIIKRFGIKKEEALDWCTVLTEHGFAELVYPAFGEPELRLKS